MDGARRFTIRVDLWVMPLLAAFGVFGERRTVTVGDEAMRVRFGFWDRSFPRARIVGARRVGGNLLWGLGWHGDFFRYLVVNGSLDGMVEIRFNTPQSYRLLGIPGRCAVLRLSMDDPDALIAALGS